MIGPFLLWNSLLGAQSVEPRDAGFEQLRIVVPEVRTSGMVPDGRYSPGEWVGAYEFRISDKFEVLLMADSADLCIGFRFLDVVEADFVAEVYIAVSDREFLNLHSSGALGEGVNRFSESLERAAFGVGNSMGWESNVTGRGARAEGKEFKINRQKLPGSILKLASGLIVANSEVRETAQFPDRFNFADPVEWIEIVLPSHEGGLLRPAKGRSRATESDANQ